MNCPRCGFPTDTVPCRLCGQEDFDAYEMNRFKIDSPKRFEFTIVIKHKNLPHLFLSDATICNLPHVVTNSQEPVHYYFVPDRQYDVLAILLKHLNSVFEWVMLINGRQRPFTQELWLPLTELTESS